MDRIGTYFTYIYYIWGGQTMAPHFVMKRELDGSVVECWTHDQKVPGLSPSWSGRIFFSMVNFLC